MTVRLQKFLADAGVASRRAGEEMILAGQVSVNGEVIRTLGTKVDPLHDRVTADGRAVKAKKKLYIAVHKPPGYICSRSDPEQRRTVEDLFPKEWGGILHSVGRLECKIHPHSFGNKSSTVFRCSAGVGWGFALDRSARF